MHQNVFFIKVNKLLNCESSAQLLCGQEECIQCLLEQEASVLLDDARGRTSIHLAAARGHASWLSELLSIACSEPPSLPPLRDHSGYTPLHWACYYGRWHTLHTLIDRPQSAALGCF